MITTLNYTRAGQEDKRGFTKFLYFCKKTWKQKTSRSCRTTRKKSEPNKCAKMGSQTQFGYFKAQNFAYFML